jgi:hypothetical protein
MTFEIKKYSISKNKKNIQYEPWTKKGYKLLRTIISANGNYVVKVFGADANIFFK